jgi:hypothetical protein
MRTRRHLSTTLMTVVTVMGMWDPEGEQSLAEEEDMA